MDSSILERYERCRSLGHPEAYWCRRRFANGDEHLSFWCETCERPVTHECYAVQGTAVSANWLRDTLRLEPAALPLLERDVRFRLCARCGRTGACELHHIAPRAAFADADLWPLIALCRACHHAFTSGFEAYVSARVRKALREAAA
jgi:hypothetical protein